jgi:AcrR family transcriptional regulator
MSIEQVAALAKVAKSAVYRRWSSKAEMVFALAIHGEAIEAPADHGSLAEDLRILADRVIALLSSEPARQALPGLLADLRGHPLLTQRFHASFIDAERQLVQTLLDRAVHRGEIMPASDAAQVHAQLLGTVFAWIFLVGEEAPPDLARRVSTSVVTTLRR